MFFSEAIALIEPKLCINHWKVLYKLCVFYVDRNSKMTTTAGHSFYIGPIGSFYNQVNDTGSWEPLVLINRLFPVGIVSILIHLLTHMLLFSSHLAMLAINSRWEASDRYVNRSVPSVEDYHLDYHPLALAFSFYNSNELLAYMYYAYHAMLDGHIKNFVLNI